MIEWIFDWIYVTSDKWIFLIYLFMLLVIIFITVYLVMKELGRYNDNK